MAVLAAFGEEAPGSWLSERAALQRYRRIFIGYRVFGDDGWLTRINWNRGLLWRLKKLVPRAAWYDTHAARTS